MISYHHINPLRSILLLTSILLGVQCIFGQSALQEFKKILNVYSQEGTNLQYRLSYAHFEGKSKSANDTMSVLLTQNGGNYLMKASTFEWLKEGSKLLWVDHEKQQMVLQNANANVGSFTLDQLEQMIQNEGYQLVAHLLNKGTKVLRLSDPESPEQSIEIIYDPKTYFIFRTVIQSVDDEEGESNTKLVISYQDYQIKKGAFPWSMKNYFSESSKQRQINKRYRNYSLQVL